MSSKTICEGMFSKRLDELFEGCLKAHYIEVENDGSYFLAKNGTTLYVFLESSNGRKDWENNLDFWPILIRQSCQLPSRPYNHMECCWFAHRGFVRVWKSIESYIAKEILDLHYKKIIIVGYSHGAALAVLCHEFVWFQRPDLRKSIEGYGFGCPRVFWGMRRKAVLKRWDYVMVRSRHWQWEYSFWPSFICCCSPGSAVLPAGQRPNRNCSKPIRSDAGLLR